MSIWENLKGHAKQTLLSERMRSSQRKYFHIGNTHYLELILSQDA